MEQTNLEIGIGTTEKETLKPANVKVENVEIREVEFKGKKNEKIREVEFKGKKNEKLVLRCLHPDRVESIEISQVKYENKGKLQTTGLWISKDDKGLLIKNSALAMLLNTFGAKTPKELIGKQLPTVLDEKNYLCIKGY